MLEIVKVLDYTKKYKDSKGKEHISVNYYVVSGNAWVAIRPSFAKGYIQLDCLARVIKNGGAVNEQQK